MLTLRQLRYFVATAELGQISQAAVELSISQSAVTTAIRDLERGIEVELFRRSPSGMELTPSGREFLFHAYDILQKVEEASTLRLPSAAIEGHLSVAATYTVIGYFLPNHLHRLRRSYPGLDIRLHETDRQSIEAGLTDGRFDIAVLLTSNVNDLRIAAERVVASPRRLWLTSRHPLLKRDSLGLQDLLHEPYIMLTVDEAEESSVRYWRAAQMEPNVALRTSSVEAVRSLVASGQGVAILSDMVYRPWSLEGQRLETVVLNDQVPTMDVGLAWSRESGLTRTAEAFRDYFRQAYQSPRVRSLTAAGRDSALPLT
ncbi:LysR family transcriptional regulator [Aureimonas populi]|uniref:LysR family transcriptional regulator n=1 Tax=Aureimonas populi TaxID=1701758 RepID=A0ABW5CSV1_9HYPH|nr:LysR family transcriptional regulator [Aureimonas populi]